MMIIQCLKKNQYFEIHSGPDFIGKRDAWTVKDSAH